MKKMFSRTLKDYRGTDQHTYLMEKREQLNARMEAMALENELLDEYLYERELDDER